MDDDLKGLIEQLGVHLRDAMRGSDKVQEILREIEKRGFTPSLTLGIGLGKSGRTEEVQETLLGPGAGDRPVSIRRLSAYDRKFLRALRIQMPS